jgi:hypothetical protein
MQRCAAASTAGGAGEVGLADVQEDHRRVGTRRAARQLGRGLGALHHVERVDVVEAGRELHWGSISA